MSPQNYEDLEIYRMARALAAEIHRMTLEELPGFEMYEVASQLRRSSKSVVWNIVEGFGRRRYKAEFVRFLVYASASLDETKAQLDMLGLTGSLPPSRSAELLSKAQLLGRKLYHFLRAVEDGHLS
ncbi:MAG TPA: four helix bundle protein [Caldilineae bacterium]|nr:four helix bundle protein [Caldilineae bacterium]